MCEVICYVSVVRSESVTSIYEMDAESIFNLKVRVRVERNFSRKFDTRNIREAEYFLQENLRWSGHNKHPTRPHTILKNTKTEERSPFFAFLFFSMVWGCVGPCGVLIITTPSEIFWKKIVEWLRFSLFDLFTF